MPETKRILWADDEIDLLEAHVLYLKQYGYEVTGVTNGEDAVNRVLVENFDVVLLDEHMPGMDGIETAAAIMEKRPDLPIIMITKSEEEALMDTALGSKITDYLTKPVNPTQILVALKKVIERAQIEQKIATRDYLAEFRQISQRLAEGPSWSDWMDIHARLCSWEIELDPLPDEGLRRSLEGQREECNIEFGKFVEEHYEDWIWGRSDAPPLSTDVARKWLMPLLSEGKNVLFLVVDCLRADQWLAMESLLYDSFRITRDYHFSILPSATPYSRNALFSGLFPGDIEKDYPDLWKRSDDDELSSNRFERQLLDKQLRASGLHIEPEPKYVKILDPEEANATAKRVTQYFNNRLVSMVFNFVDMLGHSRAHSEVIREMLPHEAGYRSVVRAWFEHSSLRQILQAFGKQKWTVVLTSDHGSIRAQKGTKVISDREASTGLRFKYGRNLKVDRRPAIVVNNPERFRLPKRGLNMDYIFAKESYYFVYPTNYHRYLALYKDSFLHGGCSLEEMILPVVTMEGKG
ncbi:MAG: bifunctional response regulator/alkaline phosphatase family protein [bacterium]|nr:bifunctional response regulator/alkaline phosphatase family protein [bacterium]